MRKLTGAITLAIGIILIVLFIYGLNYLLNTKHAVRTDEILVLISAPFLSFCTIHYTLVTRFWKSTTSIIEELDRENEIIKRQIEKQELLAKLEIVKAK